MTRTLSEADSKALLREFSIPFADEELVSDPSLAAEAATRIGFPVAIKLCGANVAHKTERGLVRLGVTTAGDAATHTSELLEAATEADEATGVLISPMISGSREFIAGVSIDPDFGPTVLFGVGGVMTEVLNDATVRLAPISRHDAREMVDSIENGALLRSFRGDPPVDVDALVDVLMSLSELASTRPDVVSVDLNPLIIQGGSPVAVDALVELTEHGESTERPGRTEGARR